MQVYIGEQWRDHRPLRAALLREYHRFAVQDARVQPPLDKFQHAAVFDSLPQNLQQRVMLQIIEKGADVTVDHLSHPVAQQALPYFLQRLMRTATRAKPVGKVVEVLLVDGFEQHRDGFGHDLVLQGGKPQRSELAVTLGDQTAHDWLRTVRVVDEFFV